MGIWHLGVLLEQKLAPLVGLSPEVRRGLVKMGDKSEAFCRETLMVLAKTRTSSRRASISPTRGTL